MLGLGRVPRIEAGDVCAAIHESRSSHARFRVHMKERLELCEYHARHPNFIIALWSTPL